MAKEKPRKNIVSFSGGKDSTALLLWAHKNLGNDFEAVFMDTGWEHDITYGYVDYIDAEILNGRLTRLSSNEYDDFEDLSQQKGRMPSTKARFCTQKLKLEPLIAYFDTLRDEYEIHNYVGIRADESTARSKMEPCTFDLDYFGCWVHRPLLKWTAEDVFNILKRSGIEPNPLYKMGMKRVGCMPCIMSNHTDMRQIIKKLPEVIDEIRNLEQKVGRSFFPPNYIPDRFCSRSQTKEIAVTKTISDMYGEREVELTKTKTSYYPMIDDVVDYLQSKEPENQTEAFDRETASCMSHYNICE